MAEPTPPQVPIKTRIHEAVTRTTDWSRRKQHEASAMLHLFSIDDGSGDGTASRIFTKSDKHITINGQEIHDFTIKRHDKDSIPVGIDGARLVHKKIDKAGNISFVPLNYRFGEAVPQGTIDGILVRDASGKDTMYSMDSFSFAPQEPTPAAEALPIAEPITVPITDASTDVKPAEAIPTPAVILQEANATPIFEDTSTLITPPHTEATPTPEPTPPTALTNLEKRAAEPPKSISLIGLDVDQIIQTRAGKDMEVIAAKGGNIAEKFIRNIWKGNVAHELLEEHAYQFRKKQVDAARMMLSDETFAVIQNSTEKAYTVRMEDLKKNNKFIYRWTQFKDAVARNIGLYTTKEMYAITLAGEMSARGEIGNLEQYEQGMLAVRDRFEKDFLDTDGVIRKNLGENLEIFKSGDPKHKEIVDGIKDLVHKYANGEFKSKQELDKAMTEFAKQQGIGANTKTAQEAQMYASSLYQIANEAKARITSGESMNAIDAQLDAMEIRIGRAQMGEATQIMKTDTRKTVEWLLQKNIVGTIVVNETFLGTFVAASLSLAILPRMGVSRVLSLWGIGAAGGGAVAGAIAGFKENARRKHEWFQYMRQRETGGGTAVEGDKLRDWMGAREIKQMSLTDIMSRYTATAYKDGKFNADISEADLTKTLAFLADAKARRALSARGGENVSLIQWGPAVDVGRTNLDLSIDKLERDLQGKFGQTISERTKLLTDVQTNILAHGREAAQLDDPLKVALDAVKDNDIGVKTFKRNLVSFMLKDKSEASGSSVQGLDAAIKEVKKEIRLEAIRKGVNSAVIGTAIGSVMTEVPYLVAHYNETLNNAMHWFHIGQETHTVVTAGTTLVPVPNMPPVIDTQGLPHAIQIGIPDHTRLIADATQANTFNLVTSGKESQDLVKGIMFDNHGKIINAALLNNNPIARAHGIVFGKSTPYQIQTPGGVDYVPKTVIDHITDTGKMDLKAADWPADGSGFWGWAQQKLGSQHYDNPNAVTNSVKNLLRGYEANYPVDASGHVTNVIGVPNIPYHATPGTPEWKNEIWYNALPKSTVFHDVPNSLFSDTSMKALAKATDEAATWYRNGMAQSSMDQLHQIALKGYFGMEKDVFTRGDLEFLMKNLGGTTDVTRTITEAVAKPDVTTTLFEGLISRTTVETANAVPGWINMGAEVASVIPLPREGMKPGKPNEMKPGQLLSYITDRDTLDRSVYGDAYYGAYAGSELTEDQKKWYKARFSDRINADTKINLDARVEIPDYFKKQSAEHLQTLNGYVSQEGMQEPMNDNCDAIACIPIYTLGEGKVVQGALEQYLLQVDKTKNKQAIEPNKFELILFLNHPEPKRTELEAKLGKSYLEGASDRVKSGKPERYDTEEVIKQFQTTHPELKIRVIKAEYKERQKWGNIIKELYDTALLRASKRTNPTHHDPLIITNDIDVVNMSPTYVRDILQKMDLNDIMSSRDPSVSRIDGLVGKIDMPNHGYEKLPGFLVSERLYQYLDSKLRNSPNRRAITQGRNTILRGSTYAAIGGANPLTDAGADTELGKMVSLARENPKTIEYINKTWLNTDPRREVDMWSRGIPLAYAWNEWAAMDVYGADWQSRFNKPPENPLVMNKTTLESEIAAEQKRWGLNATDPQMKNALSFIGFKDGDYTIENDVVIINNVDNVGANTKKYVDEKRWEGETRKKESALNSEPTAWVAPGLYAEYLNYEEYDRIYSDIFVSKEYPWTPEQANPKPNVIDLGSHIGMSVLYWKSLAPGAKITAVEANPQTTDVLKRNVASNHLTDVSVVNGAAAGHDGTVDLFTPKDGVDFHWGDFTGGRPVNEDKYNKMSVPAIKVSTLITEPVDLLKVDIEGAELEVLKEAESKLPMVKEIMMEFHIDPENPVNSYSEMMDLLKKQGYTVEVRQWNQPIDAEKVNTSEKSFLTILAKRPPTTPTVTPEPSPAPEPARQP